MLHNVDIEKSSTVKRLARAKIAKKDFFKILNLMLIDLSPLSGEKIELD